MIEHGFVQADVQAGFGGVCKFFVYQVVMVFVFRFCKPAVVGSSPTVGFPLFSRKKRDFGLLSMVLGWYFLSIVFKDIIQAIWLWSEGFEKEWGKEN